MGSETYHGLGDSSGHLVQGREPWRGDTAEGTCMHAGISTLCTVGNQTRCGSPLQDCYSSAVWLIPHPSSTTRPGS